ncbi:DUF4224 domain-containing protein [Lonepinella koalarum]
MEINLYADFLSPEEIHTLTGTKQAKRQIKWLNEVGIPFKENIKGKPIVRRDYTTQGMKRPLSQATPKPKVKWASNTPEL